MLCGVILKITMYLIMIAPNKDILNQNQKGYTNIFLLYNTV
jgi:hypothetical protein